MTFTAYIVLALIAGVLAKLLTPGRDFVSWSGTPMLGAAGLLLGSRMAARLGMGAPTQLDVASVMVTTVGAMLIYAGYRMLFDAPEA